MELEVALTVVVLTEFTLIYNDNYEIGAHTQSHRRQSSEPAAHLTPASPVLNSCRLISPTDKTSTKEVY